MIIKELVRLANHFDSVGLVKEADYLDKIISMASDEYEALSLGYDPSGGFYDAHENYRKYADSIRDDIYSAFKSFDKSMLSDDTKEKLEKFESYGNKQSYPLLFRNRCPVYPSFRRTKDKNGYEVLLPYETHLSKEEVESFVNHIKESGAIKSYGGGYYQKDISPDGSNIVIRQVVEFKPVVEDIDAAVRFIISLYGSAPAPHGYEDLDLR